MERLLETILGSFLSDYVSTSKETATGPFKAYLSSSGISLHDIEFNTSKISLPSFSIDAATAKSLEVKVPWASLGTQPIEVSNLVRRADVCPMSSLSVMVYEYAVD
jgi:hypothetical protein